MSLRLLHRRLAVGMALSALLAFAGSAGLEPLPALLAGVALVVALFWRPRAEVSEGLERLWIPLAAILVLRALWGVFFVGGDVVIPVVDLLLLLLAAESLRSLDADNGIRIYSLSFALLLASSAYRPGAVFAVAFVAYVTLGTLALTVGHVQRRAERTGARGPGLDRRLLLPLCGLSAVTLVASVLVFALFPRVSRGWTGRGEVLATSLAGFSGEVSLAAHGARIFPNPEVVLRVEFGEGRPGDLGSLHWRGRSYDHFDGVRWRRSQSLPAALVPLRWYRERWPDETRTQRVYAAPLEQRVIFALHPVLEVEAESAIQPVVDDAGDLTYWGSDRPAYTARSVEGRPPADSLRAASDARGPAERWYLQLPPGLGPRFRALADSLSSGVPTRYDRAVAVERWLRSEFEYTLDLPDSPEEATIEHFLFERRAGHCEYFSTAMVLLLREMGIAARNVNGFLGGEWNEFGGYAAVTQNQAHSWVEVWFPGYGWVTFDPTPAGSGEGLASESLLWPGRMLLDGLSHRWGKWVLDYSPEEQSSLMAGLRDLVGGDGAEGSGERRGEWDLPPWAWALLAGIGAGVVLLVRRGRDTRPPIVRAYLRVRDGCASAGLPVGPATPPARLVELLGDRRHPAHAPVGSVVRRYLEVRFGGRDLDEDAARELHETEEAALRALGGAR